MEVRTNPIPSRPPAPPPAPTVAPAPSPAPAAPPDQVAVSASAPTPSAPPAPSPKAAAQVTAALAGPPAAPLSDSDLLAEMTAEQARGIAFQKARHFYIPGLMKPTAPEAPPAVLQDLDGGRTRDLRVQAPDTESLPLGGKNDIEALAAFYTGGDVRALADPSLGALLRDIQMDGCGLRDGAGSEAAAVGPYGAFHILRGDWGGHPGGAWVWREGTPLNRLPGDAGANSAQVRDAIRQSRQALDDLEKKAAGGDGDARLDLEALRGAVGDAPFSVRAQVLQQLHEKRPYDHDQSRIAYTLVARSTRPGEKLEDVAGFMLRLYDQNKYVKDRDIFGSFNYVRSNFADDPVLVDSFQQVYGRTHDISTTIRAVDVLRQPIRSEAYADRQAAYQSIFDNETKLSNFDAGVMGQQALDDYQYVAADLRPGETLAGVNADFVSVLQGLQQAHRGIGEAKATFRYVRDNLSLDPQRRAYFMQAFSQLGTTDLASQALDFIEQPRPGIDAKTAADVFNGLLRNVHSLPDAKQYFNDVAASVKPGEDFGQAGAVMFGLMDDMRKATRWGAPDLRGISDAYAYARSLPDAAAVDRFRSVVRDRGSLAEATRIYPLLRTPVHAEGEADRVDTFLRLTKLNGWSKPEDWYQLVAGHLLPSETLKDGADQFEALTKALRQDNYRQDVAKAFVEMKQRNAQNPDEVRLFTRLCGGLQSYKEAVAARQDLDLPLAGEPLPEREKTFFQLLDLETRMSAPPAGAVEDYHSLQAGLVPGESVADGLTRFIALRSALKGKTAAHDASDLFAFIAENLKNGAIKDRTANEITAEMVESLLLNGDVNAAKNRALAPRNPVGGIEREGSYVVIGGIRVPVQK